MFRLVFTFLALSSFALLSAPDPAAQGRKGGRINLDTTQGYIQAQRKIHCSLEDGKPVFFMWEGTAWSRVPGERDKMLFQVEGMNVRQCVTVNDPDKGRGYRMVSREIMLYKDPKTGEVLRKWQNPWTNEEVEVIHVANDPVNQPPNFGLDRRTGKPAKLPLRVDTDGDFYLPYVIPLFYTNPLAGEYQEQVGGTYHSAEIFDFHGNLEDLLDLSRDRADVGVAWVRMAPWLPWMNMGSRVGMMYFNATGNDLPGFGALSDTLRREIDANYPEYRVPPPSDDARKNHTSWTYFKEVLDKRKKNKKK